MAWDDYDDEQGYGDSFEENMDGYSITDGDSDLLPEDGGWETMMAVDIEAGVIPSAAALDGREDITGQLNNDREYNSAKRESYEANKQIRALEREIDNLDITGSSPDERMGKMTAADLQLGRFSHMDGTVRNVAKQFLSGQDNFGLDKLEADAARETFGSIIDSDPADWAKQLKIDASELPSPVNQIDPITGNITGTIDAPVNKKDIGVALGMIKDSAGYYMDKGVGSKLAGQGTSDQVAQMELDYHTAMKYADELAGLYIHKKTVGSDVEKSRRAAVRDALIDRAISGVYGEDSTSILPLPNEVPVMGLKPTLSYSGDPKKANMGTSFDRVGFEIEAAKRGWAYGDQEWFDHKPNIKASLFGRGKKNKKKNELLHDSALEKMHFIRKTMRAQFPTNRDESKGQGNTSGWDRPYGEQSLSQDAWDLASIIGLDKERPDLIVSQSKTPNPDATKASGQEEGGMYGAKGLSDTDRFVQMYINNPELEAEFKSSSMEYSEDTPSQFIRWQLEQGVSYGDEDFNDTGLMQKFMQSRDDWVSEGIKQRTPEWYAARKGMVTASTLLGEKGKELSAKELSYNLAARKLGYDEEFLGNDYTNMGNKGEKLALQAFLNQQKSSGNPLTHKEVGLITNDEYGGMGVSPDGRLFDKDGKSAGLLELKYLSDVSDKNIKKYEAQMQMQMMITGETVTHFFALNRFTNESNSRIVKADPEFQKELKSRIDTALEMSGEITNARELLKLKGEIMSEAQTAKQRSGKGDETGQTESVDLSAEEEVIKPFDPKGADNSKTGKIDEKERIAYSRKQAIRRGFSSIDEMEKFDTEALADKEKAEADKLVAKAAKERAAADKESAKASKQFSTSVKDAIKKLTNFAVGSNESSMDTVRAAAMSGMTAEQARGIEFAMTESGATLQGARATMASAGTLQAKFNDANQVAGTLTNLTTAWEGAGLSKSFGRLPSIDNFQGKTSPEIIAFVKDLIGQAESPEQAKQIGAVFDMEYLVTSTATGAEILEAGILDKEGAYAFNRANLEVGNTVQTVSESITNVTGAVGGYITGGAILGGDLATVGGAIAGMYASKKALDAIRSTQTSQATKGSISSMAKSGLSSTAATASKLTKAGTPIAAVSGVGRMAFGVEDDGGVADSLLDIAEFTAVGSMFGPAGAAIGAGVGTVNELGEMAGLWGGNEDLVPTKDIVDKPTVSRGGNKVSNINDIDVNVLVTPDEVKTNVTANGEDYSDTEVY